MCALKDRAVWLEVGLGMGEMNKEPSMEEILSSIKRIIAEDAESAVSARTRTDTKARTRRDSGRQSERENHRKAVIANMVGDNGDEPLSYVDEVLELTDEMPRMGKGTDMDHDVPAAVVRGDMAASPRASASVSETIVSVESELAARTSLAALSSMIVKAPDQGEAATLEGLVREMLRPMLKDWLDVNLPNMVEGMVAREIARITGRPL